MLTSLRTSTPLLLSTVFLLMGVGLLHTHIALEGRTLGFSVAMIGVLTSAYYAGFLVGTYTVPRLTHRIGHIRTFAFCTALVTLVVLVQALEPSYGLWLVLRVLQGLLLVGLYAIIESWLNASADPAHRSSVFAVYMMVNLGASAAAQQLLRIRGEGFVLFCVVAILFCAASLPVVTSRQPQPHIRSIPRVQIAHLFRLAPTALVSALLSGLALGAFWGLLPVYAAARGLDLGGIGTYVSVGIAGGVVLQWPLGRFSDRIDRRLALSLISAVAALAALTNLFLPGAEGVAAMVVIFAFGGMSFTLYPIAVAHLVDYVHADELLSASSTVLLVNGIGSALGPLLAGTLMSLLGPKLLFVWFAVLDGALAAYAFHRFTRRKREVTPDDNFVPLVNTGASALDLHAGDAAAEEGRA
ncbi:MFS transporter [Frateuria hangzhouensis]|uniref:MFS transporter n=1 Tax=Frateuria hangzhouensis TaxID=2995589 RepID=UPI002260EAC9|nr:MFS transporter [Frateuria sp. STR12]MCX7514663.1 MFS transporter [Frateuria sp. STR12]